MKLGRKIKNVLASLFIGSSISCASIPATRYRTIIESEGERAVLLDGKQVIIDIKRIRNPFGMPLKKKINKKNYILVRVITSCMITNQNGKVYEELTTQGELPKNVPEEEIVTEVSVLSKSRMKQTSKEFTFSFGETTITGDYSPE
ncbi:MAG TPA: hypothetical protein VJI68_01670 [Candidatus Nanoarchaeia archaeon]|nr:hypothetical protein [Candidatus Nanoarchaeia archaeon]